MPTLWAAAADHSAILNNAGNIYKNLLESRAVFRVHAENAATSSGRTGRTANKVGSGGAKPNGGRLESGANPHGARGTQFAIMPCSVHEITQGE
jgi:hypothetical protein